MTNIGFGIMIVGLFAGILATTFPDQHERATCISFGAGCLIIGILFIIVGGAK